MDVETRVHKKLSGTGGGIHSVEIAAAVLLELANFRHPTSLKMLSARCRMSPSKVHRYLESLVKTGFAYQGQKSGNYSLGRNAISIGLAAMQQMDQIEDVIEGLPDLVARIKNHVTLTVWSKLGPTIIRQERSDNSIVVPLLLGLALPVLRSASGRIFAAFLPACMTSALIESEIAVQGATDPQYPDQFEPALQDVRNNRFAISRGEVESNVTAVAVPVLDWQQQPTAVIAALVSKHAADSELQIILRELMRFADKRSIPRPTFPFSEKTVR